MNARLDRALTLVRAVVHEVRAENLSFMAGSIAYHAFVSLLPLLLLVLTAIATVGDASLEAALIDLTRAVLTPGASEVLVEELRAGSRSTGVSLFGLVVLLWGTLRIFRGLDTAFSAIYESETANTFLDQLTDGLLVLVTVAVAIVVASLVEGRLPAGSGSGLWLLSRLALAVGLSLALYPMYYVFPDIDVTALEVVPGVVLAAVGLTLFESIFRLYVQYSARQPRASALAGILVFLTFLYVTGFLLLLGAATNAVLSNRSSDVNVDPLVGGVAAAERPDRELPRRTDVVASLDRLDRLLADADEAVVLVDGERVPLPVPDVVVTGTGSSRFLPASDVGLELRWSTREE